MPKNRFEKLLNFENWQKKYKSGSFFAEKLWFLLNLYRHFGRTSVKYVSFSTYYMDMIEHVEYM